MSKMYYFSYKFSKITSAKSSPPPVPFNFWYWRSEVVWFSQIVVFQTDYDEIEL